VHLAQCWSCLRSGKATLLGPYGDFTKARRYADRLRAVTALSRRRRTRRIMSAAVTAVSYAVTTPSWRCHGVTA